MANVQTPATADIRNGQAGILAPTSRGWAFSVQLLTANRAALVRFVPTQSITVSQIAFSSTIAATNDDACDVGIYTVTNATTYGRLVSAGATSGKLNATAGRQVVTFAPTLLTAGTVYYAALSCGAVGGTAATLVSAAWNNAKNPLFSGSTVGLLEADFVNTSHPLPTSLTSSGGTTGLIALLVEP